MISQKKDNKKYKSPEKKVKDLEQAIIEIGFKIEETKEGEIKVLNPLED